MLQDWYTGHGYLVHVTMTKEKNNDSEHLYIVYSYILNIIKLNIITLYVVFFSLKQDLQQSTCSADTLARGSEKIYMVLILINALALLNTLAAYRKIILY